MINWQHKVSRGVLVLGVIWGIASLWVGRLPIFTLNDDVLDILAVFCAYVAPITAALLAIRKPQAAALLLGICLLILQGLGFLTGRFHGAISVSERFAVQNLLFMCAYMVAAHLRA
jgi:hypothetical protein